jgi:hypothetical protein
MRDRHHSNAELGHYRRKRPNFFHSLPQPTYVTDNLY